MYPTTHSLHDIALKVNDLILALQHNNLKIFSVSGLYIATDFWFYNRVIFVQITCKIILKKLVVVQ